MTYSIEPDDVPGRVFYTKLSNVAVSTVQLSIRDEQPQIGTLLAALDALLGRDGDYETAIMADKVRVVASADTIQAAEQNHRKAVENLLENIHLPELFPPVIRLLDTPSDEERR